MFKTPLPKSIQHWSKDLPANAGLTLNRSIMCKYCELLRQSFGLNVKLDSSLMLSSFHPGSGDVRSLLDENNISKNDSQSNGSELRLISKGSLAERKGKTSEPQTIHSILSLRLTSIDERPIDFSSAPVSKNLEFELEWVASIDRTPGIPGLRELVSSFPNCRIFRLKECIRELEKQNYSYDLYICNRQWVVRFVKVSSKALENNVCPRKWKLNNPSQVQTSRQGECRIAQSRFSNGLAELCRLRTNTSWHPGLLNFVNETYREKTILTRPTMDVYFVQRNKLTQKNLSIIIDVAPDSTAAFSFIVGYHSGNTEDASDKTSVPDGLDEILSVSPKPKVPELPPADPEKGSVRGSKGPNKLGKKRYHSVTPTGRRNPDRESYLEDFRRSNSVVNYMKISRRLVP